MYRSDMFCTILLLYVVDPIVMIVMSAGFVFGGAVVIVVVVVLIMVLNACGCRSWMLVWCGVVVVVVVFGVGAMGAAPLIYEEAPSSGT